jgi:phosphate/sulfate permease
VDWKHVRLTASPLQGEVADLRQELAAIRGRLEGRERLGDVPPEERWPLRADILRVRQALLDFEAHHAAGLSPQTRARLLDGEKRLLRLTEYAPRWVPLGVALALGIGTMVGWRRIVVTVGEKIGNTPMSYAQGTTAQLVTAGTILAADVAGAPVSTTHVLSSAVAGGMAAGGSGLQAATLRNIALAWLLTLPASLFLGAVLFLASRAVLGAYLA